ncbi:MAG: hypothetical protein Q4B43_05250 [Bacteroidota bacterium]|nr:hypothetical protein [Bacteroidota bacterium]
MEVLKDIFVPYEIAVKLKEIGFDEPCIAGYTNTGNNLLFESNELTRYVFEEHLVIKDFNSGKRLVSAPTWEQVLKWFRDKNYSYNIYKASDLTYFSEVYKNDNQYLGGTDFLKSYEQTQEQLILKLIEVYKNEQNI